MANPEISTNRVQEDLHGMIIGDVFTDEVTRQLYATDSGMLGVRPAVIVCPRTTRDVATSIRYAAENGLSVHTRGAGTGIAGGSLGPGVILDMSRYLRRVVADDESSIIVQAGMPRERLAAYLAQDNRMVGIDGGNDLAGTVGAAVSVDGAGRHYLRHGFPSDHVISMLVVTADGRVLQIERNSIYDLNPDTPDDDVSTTKDREILPQRDIRLETRLARELTLEKTIHQPALATHPFTTSNAQRISAGCGYRIHSVLDGDQLNPVQLLAGAEGTLGVITELCLATQPCIRHHGAILLWFNRLDEALASVSRIVPLKPDTCDLIDRRRLSLLQGWHPTLKHLVHQDTEAVLVIEYSDQNAGHLHDRMNHLVDQMAGDSGPASGYRLAFDGPQLRLVRRLVANAERSLARVHGPIQSLPLFGDIGCRVEDLPQISGLVQTVLKRHRLTASFSGHAGNGQLQVHPLVDFSQPDVARQIDRLATDMLEAIDRHSGTIGARGGCGRQFTPWLARYHESLLPTFRRIKQQLDPDGILNPDVILASEPDHGMKPSTFAGQSYDTISPDMLSPRYRLMIEYGNDTAASSADSQPEDSPENALQEGRSEDAVTKASGTPASSPDSSTSSSRPPHREPDTGDLASDEEAAETLRQQLLWDPSRIAGTAITCTQCGDCRSRAPGGRMCPMFRVIPIEQASPRSKANLTMGLLSGDIELDQVAGSAFKSTVDLCIHCHQCRIECPASIDTVRLTMDLKHAHVAAHGLSQQERIMSHMDQMLSMSAWLSIPVNWLIGDRFYRWIMEKTLGIAQGRKLPRMAKFSYLSRLIGNPIKRPARRRSELRVALFIDTYSNFFDIRLIERVIDVLRHNGVDVFVPPRQRSSGMHVAIHGDLDRAARLARANVTQLAEAVRLGYEVVTIEPTAAATIRFEYPAILDDDEEARLVASHTYDVCQYLHDLHARGLLKLDFKPLSLSIAYHRPCRMAALSCGSPGEELLRLIPGLTVERIEAGCCGMAGTLGMRKDYYKASLRAGRKLMRRLRSPRFVAGATECNWCKIQMEQGAHKPTVHPIKILAMAYGLTDESLPQLPKNRLIVS